MGANQIACSVMSDDSATITRIPLHPKARREGYLAGRRGRKSTDNPYPFHSREAVAWEIGRGYGLRKPLRPVDDR
jgi:hypothetical protein